MNNLSLERAGHVERRARALALEKSYLELVIRLMSRTSENAGVENVVDALMHGVLDVIGGTNIVLYYRRGADVHMVDVYGNASVSASIDDPVVQQVFDARQPVEREEAFEETRMQTPEFTKAYTWVYPLVAGQDIIGVLKMEHLHIGMRDLYKHLPVFFTYAAHVLKNEVQNFGRLSDAYQELNGANEALRQENLARRRSEEELQRAKDLLEQRVDERTRDLAAANAQLEVQLAERTRAESTLRRRNEELAGWNRFLRKASGDATPTEVLGFARQELSAYLHLPYGRCWLIDDTGFATPVEDNGAAGATDERRAPWDAAVFVRDVLARREPLFAERVQDQAWLREAAAQFTGVHVASMLALPLWAEDSPVGCILLASPVVTALERDDVSLTARFGEGVSAALARMAAQADSRRLRAAIEQAPDSIIITDESGRILYVNPAFTHLTGYKRAEIVGQNPRRLKSGHHDRAFYEKMWATLLVGDTWHGHLVNRKKNGDLFTEDAIIVPVRNSRGRVTNYIGLKRDITRELAREEHLRHAQRMEGIGQLAGGIAHDFNNLLGVIMMQLEMIELEHDLPPAVAEGVSEVRKASERAAKLTRQLLSFGRRQPMKVRTHDLNEVVSQYEVMLGRVMREAIRLEFEPSAQPLPFSGDASMIEQVVMNLCINARDAMPAGGRLRLGTGIAEFGEDDLQANPDARPGRFVWLRVTDEGTGIPPEAIGHLFEPFFTTKGVGHGTGLGLATSYGIVTQHHGWIDVVSEVGNGATFTVYLPWTETAPPPRVVVPTSRPETGHATVLLAEDEPGIRRMTQRCLEQLGYRVLAAVDGVEALRLWEREGASVDLLLTDVVMPNGVSGVELSQRLRHERPGLPVIVMSGYPADIARQGGQIDADVQFMHKPFTLTQLGALVKQALGRTVH